MLPYMTTIQSLKDFLPPFNHYLEIGPNFFIPIFVQKTKTEFWGGFVLRHKVDQNEVGTLVE